MGLAAASAREPATGFELISEQTTIQQAAIEQYRLGDLCALARIRVFLHPGHAMVDRNPRLGEDRLVIDCISKTEWPVYVDYPENRYTVVLLAGRNDVLPQLRQRSTVRRTGDSHLDLRVNVFDGIFHGHGMSLVSGLALFYLFVDEFSVVEEIDHAGLNRVFSTDDGEIARIDQRFEYFRTIAQSRH